MLITDLENEIDGNGCVRLISKRRRGIIRKKDELMYMYVIMVGLCMLFESLKKCQVREVTEVGEVGEFE